MTQFFYRFTKGGGSTVVQCSVLACSVDGFGQEVGKGLLMSAHYIYIYLYISISHQHAGCFGGVTDQWSNSQSNKVGACLPCMTCEFRHWTHVSLGSRNRHCK